VVQVNTENYERLSADEAMELLEALLRDEVPPPTFAADGSVTEPTTAGLHWRLAGLGDPPADLGSGVAEPTERSIGREPSPPEPTEQREAGEPQPEAGAGAAAEGADAAAPEPQAPVDGAPTGRVADGEAEGDRPSTTPSESTAPSDEGPAPEDKPRPQAGEGR
jgi:hypothetical protein